MFILGRPRACSNFILYEISRCWHYALPGRPHEDSPLINGQPALDTGLKGPRILGQKKPPPISQRGFELHTV